MKFKLHSLRDEGEPRRWRTSAVVWHTEGWAPPWDIAHMNRTTITQSIQARSSPGTRTASSVAGHQDGGEKYATDGPKSLRARNNITIGTWNVRSLRAAGKVEELTHDEMPVEHPWTL